MKKASASQLWSLGMLLALSVPLLGQDPAKDAEGWIPLFDGASLEGWKASEKEGTFTVKDGAIVVQGPRSHLYYMGPVNAGQFKNFDFKAKVMTTKGSNSGIYFHTEFQQDGWPSKGYEAQVNNTHTDPKKTGGLYGVKDILWKSPAKDDEWFDYEIHVEGKQIVIKINGQVCTDYTEPEDLDRPERMLSSGTFCLQGHDPKSLVYFKDIQVKPLPDGPAAPQP